MQKVTPPSQTSVFLFKRSFVRVLAPLAVLLLTASGHASAAILLSDTFDGASLDTGKWTVQPFAYVGGVQGADTSTISTTVGGGSLTFSGSGADFDRGEAVISNDTFVFPTTDDYVLTADITSATSFVFGSGRQSTVGIGFYANNSNYFSFDLWNSFPSTSGLSFLGHNEASGGTGYVSAPSVPLPAGELQVSLSSTGLVTALYGGTSLGFVVNPAAYSSFQVMLLTTGRTSSDTVTGDFDSVTLTGDSAAVPEPSSFALIGLGLVGCAWYRRRRRA
jgi:hypothetical protein